MFIGVSMKPPCYKPIFHTLTTICCIQIFTDMTTKLTQQPKFNGRMKQLLTDSNLSHYRIVRGIGAGAMGEVYLDTTSIIDGKESSNVVMTNKTLVKRNYLKDDFREKLESKGLEHARIYLRRELAKRRQWRIDDFLERFPSALVTDLNGNEFKGSEYVPKRVTEH